MKNLECFEAGVLSKYYAFLIPAWVKLVRQLYPDIKDDTGKIVLDDHETLAKFGRHWNGILGDSLSENPHEKARVDTRLVSSLLNLIRIHLSSF